MATDPRNKVRTVHYPGGAVIAPAGLISHVFGGIETRWQPKEGGDGKGKRKYGTSQRNTARAGRVHYLVLDDGTQWSVRVVGTTKRFIDAVLRFREGTKVVKVYTQSGTKYGDEVNELV